MAEVRCWLCGEEAYAWGGKPGRRSILVCRDCFWLVNGDETVKSLRAKVLDVSLAERIAEEVLGQFEFDAESMPTKEELVAGILRVRDSGEAKEESK